MATVDDLHKSVDAVHGFVDTISEALGEVSVALGQVATALTQLTQEISDLDPDDEDPPSVPGAVFALDAVTDTTVKVTWDGDDAIQAWRVGRNGQDSHGSGPWSTTVPKATHELTFSSLLPATGYTFSLEPVTAQGVQSALLLQATTKPTNTPPPPPSGDHGPMALARGWTEIARDDFTGAAVDATLWGIYNSAGHGGKGLRRPEAFSIVGDSTALDGRCLRVYGNEKGTTGGMAHKKSQRFGRWGVRMRFPKGDKHYHPVLLTWPSAENWPIGGEIDFAEGNSSSNKMQFFLHYSAANHQTSGEVTIDTTQWHWYEMEWGPDGVYGWCDGVQFFSDTNKAHFNYDGFGAHHGTIQLDWFPESGQTTTGTAEMFVDAYRVYRM